MATTNQFSTSNHRKSEGEHHEEDSQLKLMPEWDNFQLDRYAKVIMFGEQVKADQWMTHTTVVGMDVCKQGRSTHRRYNT